jgi:predicted nucleic acid-binding protein
VPRWRPRYEQLLGRAFFVDLTVFPRVVVDDPSDDLLVATALAGRARVVITNDRHLLDLGDYQGIRITRPGEFTASGLF